MTQQTLVAVVPPERHGLVQLMGLDGYEPDTNTTIIQCRNTGYDVDAESVGKPNYRAVAMMVALFGHCDRQLYGTVVLRGLTPNEAFLVVKVVSDAES